MMLADDIEQIKADWTDKYVVVDATRPELKRFADLVGQVKTVNMSGRALVEFADYALNIGWYDIDLDYLKIVPKPEPKPAAAKEKPKAKPAAKKPAGDAGAKKLSPLEMARQQGAAGAGGGAKPAGEKKSTADILAAARGGAAAPAKSDKPEADKPAAKGTMSTADILAAARGGGEAAPAAPPEEKPAAQAPAADSGQPAGDAPKKVDRSKLSVADMLAMARGQKSGGEPAAAGANEKAAPAEPPPEEAAEAAEVAAESPEPSDEPGEIKKVDKSSMSVDQMLAYCRNADGESGV